MHIFVTILKKEKVSKGLKESRCLGDNSREEGWDMLAEENIGGR